MEIMTTTPHSATNQKELRLFAAPITSTSTVSSTAEHMGKNGARSPFQREVREWQRIDPDTGALMTGRLEADRWISGPLNSYGKKSSSSISNSSNNSTTAMQTETTTTTTSTNFSSNLNKNSSMNTHKSMAGKNISLHAIVGNSNNLNTIGDRTTKTTASLTPSSSPSSPTTTTTTRPSWQQPTIFRQNGNSSSNNNNSPTSGNNPLTQARGSSNSSSLRNTTPQQHPSINNTSSSSTNPSSSHLTKSRVGDNNCCGGGSSSDESRSYSTAELRHHHSQHQPHHQHHHHLRQREQQTTQHEQRQSPALFQLKPQNDRLTPTQSAQLKPQQQHQQQQQQQYQSQHYNRVDLESFRHYNNNTSNSHHITSDTYAADDPTLSTDHHHPHQRPRHNDDDGDALRLSSRHMRRQQIPQETDNSAPTTSLHRSRSISTDDLSTEWDVNGVDNEEPAEWRRVSKLRRSFQNSCSTKTETATPTPARRPLDLPESSVSVSKIRAELENGRRLNTVMKNNHVDLAALSSILNGPDTKPVSPSPVRSSFLTAESLKEIRGKLKRLSDESLYKEDFLINQQNNSELPEQEHIEVQPSMIRKSVEKSPERYNDRENTINLPSKHTTNSLESRLKYKETNPTEWHLRRKSYGFEKMSPPDKSMQRMDASTDSGLGRSGELQNWSPTNQEHQRNSTVVVRLGENSSQRSSIMGVTSSSTAVQRRYRPQQSFEESENSPEEDAAPNKRHSIAVDESQYVRDNGRQTTQVRLNGFYERNSPLGEGKFVQTSEVTSTSSAGGFSQKVHQQKRVEFCKTEVHFATESGRVNIVETDSKPPPTNNFRRRRNRSSSVGPLQSLVKSATTVSTTSSPATSTVAMPVTLFGDDKLRRKTIASTTVAYRAPLVDSPEPIKETSPTTKNVTVTTVAESYVNSESSRSSYASTSGVDTTDYETDEMTSLRGILKNKPAKPKPYVLGENIETPDELWGVQVKSSRALNDSPQSNVAPIKSVAERIQDLSQTNGFSTKINLNVGSTSPPVIGASSTKTWEESGQQEQQHQRQQLISGQPRRLSAQEILLQDLKDHQRILDEGLKSTTLIIKTMRSATEFDEAMRRLSIASIEAQAATQPNKLMLRSNSYQEPSNTSALEFQDPLENTPQHLQLYKSTSFSSNSSWSTIDSRKYSLDSRKTSTDSGASFQRHGSGPRLSFLGNEEIPVSQQLQRLRLIYDAATISQGHDEGEEDSADEEVKSYFRGHGDSDSGGGTQESSSYEDDFALEHSHSWSRLKAKKTIWKIDTDNSGVVESGAVKTLTKTDLPTSNVMSIKLHSPQATTEVPTAVKVVPPVAKPRTVNSSVVSETKSTTKPYQSSLPTKDSLKIIKEARGARQLREHELSYFGIEASKLEQEKLRGKYPQLSSASRNSPKRSLPLRRLSEEMSGRQGENERSTPSKWQLEHDKPDLLKHNPPPPQHREDPSNIKPTERTSLKKKAELDEEEEHLYENIANEITPVFKVKEVYDRKLDLQRDAMILSEMNESADQTLRELSDEASLKDRKRRSLQRRNSKPLETIDEKAITEKISDTCIAVKVARGTLASEAKKSTRHSTPSPNRMNATTTTTTTRERTSSQSSVECCPRARSRSLSSEKEYDNVKAATKSTRSTQMMKHKSHRPQTERRSSSLDSQRSYHSQYSSGEEQHQHQQLRNSLRREDRSRAKTKRTSNSSSSSAALNRQDAKPSKSTSSSSTTTTHGEFKRSSSTTRSSTHKERVECNKDNVNGLATTSLSTPKREALQREPHHTSSLQRGSAISSSGRRHRDELRDSQRLKRATASGKSSEKQESNGKHASASRLSRDDERNNSMRSSSHRLERGTASAADKEKEKLSRSKAHSSRSTSQQRHEQRTTTTTTTTSSSHNNDSERIAGKSSKTKAVATTASTENTTYVSVTNLANEQTKQEILVNNEASKEIAAVVTTQTSSSFQHHRHHTVERGEEIREEKKQNKDDNDDEQTTAKTDEKIPPPKPPRKKRKQSLIPIAIPSKPERQPPSPPQSHSPSNDHSPTYEYKLKSKIIPPSYSNQSTLRKSSLPRPTSRLALLNKARKPSQKSTHSTSSSFAFLPYLPAKRNSDVSHVYDNYMLYAVPAAINTKAYQQNLVNDHAQLFGSAGGNRYHHQYHLGYGGKGLRRRTVRSTVSTHQPFGICTCS
ncbi:uncharacterized protein isoform X3 [Musca autumnalis]|uniref:uncharacterized protein isoform X3 n=1 Tax=Musca autumnalis TaxID=221902 RepID=UPI003CEC551C